MTLPPLPNIPPGMLPALPIHMPPIWYDWGALLILLPGPKYPHRLEFADGADDDGSVFRAAFLTNRHGEMVYLARKYNGETSPPMKVDADEAAKVREIFGLPPFIGVPRLVVA